LEKQRSALNSTVAKQAQLIKMLKEKNVMAAEPTPTRIISDNNNVSL
jgi:hypothetical protein